VVAVSTEAVQEYEEEGNNSLCGGLGRRGCVGLVHVAVGTLAGSRNEVILVAGRRLAVSIDSAALAMALREEERADTCRRSGCAGW
jgi:hypothetical protein